MQRKPRFLALSNPNMQLCCDAVIHVLKGLDFCVLDIAEDPGGPERTELYDLVLYFASTPVSTRISRLRAAGAKLLMIVDSRERFSLHQLLSLEADGAISYGSPFAELMTAIDTIVTRRLKFISPLLISSLSAKQPLSDPLAALSGKQLDVAPLLAEGKRNFEIARTLNINPKTVNTYKGRIYHRLGINSDFQLFRLLLDSGRQEQM